MLRRICSRARSTSLAHSARRHYRILALESSCDDACVALLEKVTPDKPPIVIDQFKRTLSSAEAGGIVPTAAHDFHHATMAPLVDEFCQKHSLNFATPPDLICCTRGPGMTGSLSSSIQLAKGLSMAWQVPVIGVHHMLGHILISQLPKSSQPLLKPPRYPFLSLLCSGGHTMLVLSKSLVDHEIIIDVNDIAAGDSLDKCARELGLQGNMLGKELEKYVNDIPVETRVEFEGINTKVKKNPFNFKLGLPFKGPRDPRFPKPIHFSFASFKSSIQSYRKQHHDDKPFDKFTNNFLAYKIQEAIFDHIIDRINVAFAMHGTNKSLYPEADGKFRDVTDIICSGGVAANRRLRQKLAGGLKFNESLQTKDAVKFHFPDLSLCTDNAIMIGVAGIEIFEKLRVKTDLSMLAIRRWPLNEIMKVDGWTSVGQVEFDTITRYDK